MSLVITEDRSKGTFQFGGYYYSQLLEIINQIGDHHISRSSAEWEKGDIVIFNYPEKEFKEEEIEKIDELVKSGKYVIFTAYYNNEDCVCDVINDVSREYGIEVLNSCVRDKDNCTEMKGRKDEKMVVTSSIYRFNKGVERIFMGYCAPVSVKGSADALVESEKGEGMAAYYKDDSDGMLIVFGTCTFWDDFSIKKFDNEKFVRNLLSKNP